MIDLFDIPNSQQDVKIFYANGSAWQTWQKTRKCNYVYIMCIGGGAGGQYGGTTDNQNGGSGGAGAITRALFNASLLSDILYVLPGIGGIGGTNTTSAVLPSKSYVALQPSLIVQNLILTSGAVVASTSSETIATQTNMNFATLGNFASTAGPANINADINPLTSGIVTAGSVGGFKNSGSVVPAKVILASSLSPRIEGGTSSTSTDGGNGVDGYTSWKPFFSVGGLGGGSSSVGNGGNGGNGGIGSGGGGGGAGQLQGGNGGNGGNGIVIIISF